MEREEIRFAQPVQFSDLKASYRGKPVGVWDQDRLDACDRWGTSFSKDYIDCAELPQSERCQSCQERFSALGRPEDDPE